MSDRVFIIAEAGVNHNGDVDLAKKLIDVAADAGADAVKFQTFKAGNMVSKDTPKAEYQKTDKQSDGGQLEMLRKLELDEAAHIDLMRYAEEKGIMFMSTPFDHDSIELLNRLGLKIFKIGSGDLTNVPYLRHIARLNKKIILSTGMADMNEISLSLKVLLDSGVAIDHITLLHTNTAYPTAYSDVNLRAMTSIAEEFGTKVGYSDHTPGIEVPVAAVAIGAELIEKHFTLSRDMEGPDHKASLEPTELKAMVSAIRNIELAMGDGIKKPSKSELQNVTAARKSIVALCDIKSGEVFCESNLSVKRPGNGISPFKWDQLIGTRAEKDYKKDELI